MLLLLFKGKKNDFLNAKIYEKMYLLTDLLALGKWKHPRGFIRTPSQHTRNYCIKKTIRCSFDWLILPSDPFGHLCPERFIDYKSVWLLRFPTIAIDFTYYQDESIFDNEQLEGMYINQNVYKAALWAFFSHLFAICKNNEAGWKKTRKNKRK